jgi:hypothetical protein
MRCPEVPMFYFHVCDGNAFFEDDEGRDLANGEEAYREAIRGLRDIMAGGMQTGELNLSCFIEIENASHELVETVFVQDAVRLTNERGRSPSRTPLASASYPNGH